VSLTLPDDLLAMQTVEDVQVLAELFASCTEHEDCRANPELGRSCQAERTDHISVATLGKLRNLVAALRLQTFHQVEERDERRPWDGGSYVEVCAPFLLRAIVRPSDVGPITLTLNARALVAKAFGRVHFVQPLLLTPGMQVHVEPWDALLLGQKVSPREAFGWYGENAGDLNARLLSSGEASGMETTTDHTEHGGKR